jgi:hypothetical protein
MGLACLGLLFWLSGRNQSNHKLELASGGLDKQVKGEKVSFKISKAVVIDDAFGPPAPGAVSSDDKDKWGDAVTKDRAALEVLRKEFAEIDSLSDDDLIASLTGDAPTMRKLWFKYKKGNLNAVHLEILFDTADQALKARADKANIVIEVLVELMGKENVTWFDGYSDAAEALASADLAVVDFYLNNNDDESIALQRIADAAPVLEKPKLLFFMSSLASLDLQKKVRARINLRSAFFDVMKKSDINSEFLKVKIAARSDSYESNVALESIIDEALKSTKQAVLEFEDACKELEVHDLRLLDLARLDAENESVQEYLTWLFSEALAAKARRLAMPKIIQKAIEPESIGFSGQIEQGQILFDMYSEVVFAPPMSDDKSIRFGELLRCTDEPNRFILILTPACDLQRCDPTKMVLCTHAIGTAYNSPKSLAKEKLFGKQGDGRLVHLFTERSAPSKSEFTLLDWQVDEVETHTVRELLGEGYKRVAVMNELFAQEVKEDVLRSIGRVGTQIDPPPPLALNAKIRWKKTDKNDVSLDMPHNEFAAAILTYSEQKDKDKEKDGPKKIPTVILSDDFKQWIKNTVTDSFSGTEMPVKLANALKKLDTELQFKLKGFKCSMDSLFIRVIEPGEQFSSETAPWLEIVLVCGPLTVGAAGSVDMPTAATPAGAHVS